MIRATRQPNYRRIIALREITFTCTAKGFDVKYEWRHHKNNSIIGRGSTYTISRATPLDEGQYYCVAMTEGGYVFSNNVTLTVNGKLLLLNVQKILYNAHYSLKGISQDLKLNFCVFATCNNEQVLAHICTELSLQKSA